MSKFSFFSVSIFYAILFAIAFTGTASASELVLTESMYKGFPNTLQGNDFFVKISPRTKKNPLPYNSLILNDKNIKEACRENIAKVICLVKPNSVANDPEERKCLPESSNYAVYFERIFDNYPLTMQKMFCSLKRIYVETELQATAYAGTIKDRNGNIDGAIMGIRQSVLDLNLDLTRLITWKEQLSFGGIIDSYTHTPDLPHIYTQSNTNANDLLYFVVAHEFGHIFDFANDLNRTTECVTKKTVNSNSLKSECKMAEGTWGALSWETDSTPKIQNEFKNRTGLCFYWCNGLPLAKTDVPQVYQDLAKTDFLSIYATTQPWDDFADSLGYFLMSQNLNSDYVIDTKQNALYDIMAKIKSPLFAAKFKFIQDFLNRSDIIYP